MQPIELKFEEMSTLGSKLVFSGILEDSTFQPVVLPDMVDKTVY